MFSDFPCKFEHSWASLGQPRGQKSHQIDPKPNPKLKKTQKIDGNLSTLWIYIPGLNQDKITSKPNKFSLNVQYFNDFSNKFNEIWA